MKDKKNIIMLIVLIVILIAAGVVIYFTYFRGNTTANINLTELNTNLETKGGFDQMATQNVDKDILKNVYQVDTDLVSEVIGKMPMMNVQASMYTVIKANDKSSAEMVKKSLEEYATKYEEQWSTYLPSQYDLVKARKIGQKGQYVYLIISENAEELEKLIK